MKDVSIYIYIYTYQPIFAIVKSIHNGPNSPFNSVSVAELQICQFWSGPIFGVLFGCLLTMLMEVQITNHQNQSKSMNKLE